MGRGDKRREYDAAIRARLTGMSGYEAALMADEMFCKTQFRDWEALASLPHSQACEVLWVYLAAYFLGIEPPAGMLNGQQQAYWDANKRRILNARDNSPRGGIRGAERRYREKLRENGENIDKVPTLAQIRELESRETGAESEENSEGANTAQPAGTNPSPSNGNAVPLPSRDSHSPSATSYRPSDTTGYKQEPNSYSYSQGSITHDDAGPGANDPLAHPPSVPEVAEFGGLSRDQARALLADMGERGWADTEGEPFADWRAAVDAWKAWKGIE